MTVTHVSALGIILVARWLCFFRDWHHLDVSHRDPISRLVYWKYFDFSKTVVINKDTNRVLPYCIIGVTASVLFTFHLKLKKKKTWRLPQGTHVG